MLQEQDNILLNRFHEEFTDKDKNLLSAGELNMHIERCIANNRESQKKIYTSFYGYAMPVCDLYANNQHDAVEILNNGFLKIFKEMRRFNSSYAELVSSFKNWLRKTIAYTAIDHFCKHYKNLLSTNLESRDIRISSTDMDILEKISYEDIIQSVKELTLCHRIVLNLFVLEGFTHEDISEKLGISTDISRSNLAEARAQLQKNCLNKIKYRKESTGTCDSAIKIKEMVEQCFSPPSPSFG